MKRKIIKLSILSLFLLFGSIASAKIELPKIFSDNMVLQQQSNVPVWGWANRGQQVYIICSWSPGDTVTVVASTNSGRWKTTVPTTKAGGPYTLKVFTSPGDVQEFHNVMLGEVWLCSGQSNMEWAGQSTKNAEAEIAAADHPNIRIFHVPARTADTPQNDCRDASWETCTPQSMKNSSAVAYFFARRLKETLHVPIGIIVAAWGGTCYETWTRKELIENNAVLNAAFPTIKKNNIVPSTTEDEQWWPLKAGVCYNQMIHPLMPYSIAGVIWYQGEANISVPQSYGLGLQTLITDWRCGFGKEFPFYQVQIAPFAYGLQTAALLREQQELITRLVPNTGMVVIHDLIDNNVHDIHPTNKQDVGLRLANLALAETYGQPLTAYKSPTFQSFRVEKGKGIVTFNHAQSGLICKGTKIEGLKIAGVDGKYFDADGLIKGNELIVSSPEVKEPALVAYCFDNTTIGNLFSKDGLPVAPFRNNRALSFFDIGITGAR